MVCFGFENCGKLNHKKNGDLKGGVFHRPKKGLELACTHHISQRQQRLHSPPEKVGGQSRLNMQTT